MASGSDYGGLIEFLLVVAFAIVALAIKGIGRLMRSGPGQGAQPGEPPPAGDDRRLPDGGHPEPASPRTAAAAGPGQGGPQTLEDFFRQLQQRRPDAPAARPVQAPMARPVQAVPVARPVAAVPADNRYSADAVARARAVVARAKTAPAVHLEPVRLEAERAAVVIRATAQLGQLDRAGLARAVLLAELVGAPRATQPYAGPPQCG